MEKKSEYDNIARNIHSQDPNLGMTVCENFIGSAIDELRDINLEDLKKVKDNIKNILSGNTLVSKCINELFKDDESSLEKLINSLLKKRLSDLIERYKRNYEGEYKGLPQDKLNNELISSIHSSDFNKTLQLILAGADVNATNNHKETALIEAAKGGHLYAVQLLIAAGANIDTQDEHNYTALMWAARGYTNIVKLLIDNGADVNSTNNHNETALMWAVLSSNEEIVKLLINAGANINTQGKDGTTAFQVAKNNRNENIIELLKNAGARD